MAIYDKFLLTESSMVNQTKQKEHNSDDLIDKIRAIDSEMRSSHIAFLESIAECVGYDKTKITYNTVFIFSDKVKGKFRDCKGISFSSYIGINEYYVINDESNTLGYNPYKPFFVDVSKITT